MDHYELIELVQHLLEEKKAQDIVVLNVTNKASIFDYVIVATGTSTRQLYTISDYLVSELKKRGIFSAIEGETGSEWILVDAGDVIVHLFKPDIREFYNLEKMWGHLSPAATEMV